MIDMARVTTMNYLKKELYELLREDPMIFDFLQKGSLDGIWYWDLENPEQEWMSPEFWTTLGYDPKNKQHLASEWQDLIHPEDLKVAFENFRKHCADPNHPYDQIVRYRHANGSTVWVRCRGVAIRDDSGKPVRMLGAHNEITVQKEAEISLQLTADTLKQAQQVAQIGSWWYDPETRLAFWSEEMFQLFGLEPGHDAVPYEDVKKRIHPRDRDRFDIAFNNAVARGVDCDLELRIVQPIGDIRYVHSKCTAIKTERNLQRSREMLVMAQEIANIGSWTWDIKTNELYWSDQFYRILGFQPGEIDPSLELFRSVIPQNDAKKEGEASKEAHELPYGNFEIEHRITTKDGDQRIIQSKGEIVNRDPDGNPLLMVGTTQDITEFRRSQEKIYEMAEMLDEAPSSITIHDLEGNFLYANRTTCEIHGYTHEEFMNLNLRHVDVPESEKLIKQRIKEILDKGQASFEVAHFHKDGAIIPMEVFVKLVEWRGQRAMMSIASDISERRKAEQALRESEQKFRNFSEQSFVGFYIIQNGFFKYVNPKFADIFGYTVDECINGMHFYQLVHTEDLARVQEQVHKRVTGQIDTVQHTFRGVKKSGEIIHVSIYGSSLIYQGRPAAIGTMMDITNELEMEKRMIQSQRMEAIGSLAGGIAHDFNNILFPIIGLSEMLVDDLPPGSTEHENAAEIYRAGIRGSGLVKQILAFGRQSGQKKVPIHIQQILKEATKLSRSTIPSVITITQDIQSDCSLVRAEPTQIHQIVMNLITNAYHAAEPVNGKISVRLREVEINFGQLPECNLSPGRYALLSVSDSGVGIDPAIVHKIFEPYFTTKEQGKGTGLGLSVVYGIVKDHHGDIKVYSELGKGTTFNVYLPIMKKATETVSLEGNDALSTGHERILLVDDEVAIAKLEKQMLERLGYEVTMRVNSLEALEAFKAKSDAFDMVISDMTMPDMTGDQLARELLAIRSNIPIIICTGFSEKLNPVQAEAIGVKGFLMKPIVKAEMAKIVRRILDEAKGSDNGTVCP